jgi:hypothetical protein
MALKKAGIEGLGLVLCHAFHNRNAYIPQIGITAPGERVWVRRRGDNAFDARLGEGLGTRRRTPMVVARFQRDIGASAFGGTTSRPKG